MKKVYNLIVFLLFAVRATAQYGFEGTVTSVDGQLASYATVTLHNLSDSVMIKGTLTNEIGKFQLMGIPINKYFLIVSYTGFQKKNVYINDSIQLKNRMLDLGVIRLQESSQSLQEVIVKGERNLIEQKSDRIVMNVENSVITKGNKVGDLLQYAPRVQINSDGGISIGNKTNVLILIDGRQMGALALTNFLKTFSAEDVIKIEVITNPSSRYDASYGGVINIVTKTSLEKGINGRVAASYSQGLYNRQFLDFSLNYRKAKWNAFGNFNIQPNSWYYSTQKVNRYFKSESLFNDIENLAQYNTGSINLGLDFTINQNHLLGMRVNSNINRNRYNSGTDTYFTGMDMKLDSILRTRNERTERSQTHDLNINYRGTFKSTYGPSYLSMSLTQTLYKLDSKQDINFKLYETDSIDNQQLNKLRINNPNQQYSLITQIDYSTPIFSKKSNLDIGFRYVNINNDNELLQEKLVNSSYILDSNFSSQGSYSEGTYATYAILNNQLTKGWSTQVGLRFERTMQKLSSANLARNYTGLFPSFSINRNLEKGRSWGISYSRKISRPVLSSLIAYRYFIDQYTLFEGNPLLRPAFSNTIDSYYSLSKLSLFANYTNTRDLITQISRVNGKVYTSIETNLSNVSEFSFGITIPLKLTKWWQTNTTLMGLGSYTSTSIEDIPNFQSKGLWANIFSSNILSLPANWKAELTITYRSPMRWAYVNTKAFYWTSASLSKPFLKSKTANFRVTFSDIFKTQFNRVRANYGIVDSTVEPYFDTQRIGLSLSLRFGKKTIKQANQRSLNNDSEKSRMGVKSN